jgi:ketosteroid isomerase-like protein
VSRADLEVVLDQYAATNERDFARVMSLYADDVELIVRERWMNTGVYKGRKAVGEWFGDWFTTFAPDAKFDVSEASELPTGEVLVVTEHHARGRASGVEVRGTVVWVYRVEDGRINRVEGFPSREAALEARGLSE